MKAKSDGIPTFQSEAEERLFWETHDSTDFIDWSKARSVRLPKLRPSSTPISIELPNALLEGIKIAADKRGVPYESLIEAWLSESTDDVKGCDER